MVFSKTESSEKGSPFWAVGHRRCPAPETNREPCGFIETKYCILSCGNPKENTCYYAIIGG